VELMHKKSEDVVMKAVIDGHYDYDVVDWGWNV